jgi:hypothetical protein
MMRKYWILAAMALLLPLSAAAAEKPALSNDATSAAFQRLKSLEGNWETKGTTQGDATISYKVIANGSAVLERFNFVGHPEQEMVTMYTVENGKLVLTHYCMAGNQPRMLARSFSPATGELAFDFAGGSNIAAGAGHMHSASFKFTDADHFSSNWQFVEAGKTKFTEDVTYTRVR